MLKRIFILGCVTGASFFISCSETPEESAASTVKDIDNATGQKQGEPEMYEASELALLMRRMYDDNLEIREEIVKGNIPESFPEDFYTIHSAASTPGMIKDTNTYKALAGQYLKNIEAITNANTPQQAKIAYNDMVLTCSSCHMIYCQGPLEKIRKMKIKNLNE